MQQAELTAERAQLKSLADSYLDALNRHDAAGAAALHTPNGVVESPMFATLHGRPAIEESYRQLFTSFPDMEFHVESLLIDPPSYAVTTRNVATHEGDFFGLPPTHRRVEILLARVVTTEDGLIKDERRIYDFTGLLVQVGVLRAKPAKPA
jgi:steroid delta-isomerase-like uncharacterized protein